MPGPLETLVVVDVSRVMSGSIVGMLLADHGADVIKLEPKGGAWFAHRPTRKSWDRGKRSLELDYENAEDLASIKALIGTADVLIHSLEEEALPALHLDPAGLQATHPGLISCALTAYGYGTPFAGRPFGESLAAARLGLMVDKKSPFRPGPIYPGHPALHYGQAFVATIDILAALNARHATGKGQAVDASLIDALVAQAGMGNWWQENGVTYSRKGAGGAADRFGHTRLVTGMFQCGDGLYLQMHTGGARGFKRSMDVLGFGDRVRDVGPMEMAVPLDDDEYQIARVEMFDAFKTKSRDEWITLFHEQDIAALPVLEPAEVLLDDQVEFAKLRLEVSDPEYGTIHQAGPALRYRNNPPARPEPAPRVGEHNGQLSELLARKSRASADGAKRDIRHPLAGIRVLDCSSFFACGYAARLLSDLGADVIKVEAREGDQMRPLPDPFEAAQRGKRDIVIDLKNPAGLAIMHELVGTADVVMHNQRPGKAEKLGIGYDTLHEINPRLIYAYLPGYGSAGPKAKLKSFAPLVSGWTGLLYEGGGRGNPPTNSVFGNEDYNNGLLGAVGVLMALHRREVTGAGDYMECPQLHSSLFTTAEHFLDADRNVVYGMRLDQAQMGFSALDRIYRATDGWICVCCNEDERFAALVRAVGHPELVSDDRFATPAKRAENDAEIEALLTAFFATRDKAAAADLLDAEGAPCEVVREQSWIDDFLWDDWAVETGRVFEHFGSMHGHIREIGLFNHLSGTPGLKKNSAPRLGEHTFEILQSLGYDEKSIENLDQSKAVMIHRP